LYALTTAGQWAGEPAPDIFSDVGSSLLSEKRGPMPDHQIPTSHRAKVAEDILCGASYITLLPAFAMLVLPRTRRNRRIRFHACQSVLLNCLLMSMGFLLHLCAQMDQLLDVGSGARFEWMARIACMVVWTIASLSLASGREFRMPFVAFLAEKQANAWLFRRLARSSVEAPVTSKPRFKEAMQLSS
jgi:uncharacterized membrane protein